MTFWEVYLWIGFAYAAYVTLHFFRCDKCWGALPAGVAPLIVFAMLVLWPMELANWLADRKPPEHGA